MIGFGSIGQAMPLIERHFEYDKSRFVVIDLEEKHKELLDARGIRFIQQAVTRENYRELLHAALTVEAAGLSASTSRSTRLSPTMGAVPLR